MGSEGDESEEAGEVVRPTAGSVEEELRCRVMRDIAGTVVVSLLGLQIQLTHNDQRV